MARKGQDNIRDTGRDIKRRRAMVYLFCAFVLILCALLDVYFILGIFS